ncbi:PIG-L deacetylase family protein [Bacteroides sp.]
MNLIKLLYKRFRIRAIRIISIIFSERMNNNNEVTLIIAPHPDDEIIGCAGLIQHQLSKNKKTHIIFLTGGENSHSGHCKISQETIIKARKELAINTNKKLGLPIENLHFLNYPDGRINYEHQETTKLGKLLKEIVPQVIFIPHKGEGWSDHIQAGHIIKKLTLHQSGIRIYEYCVWFWYYNTWKIDWKNTQLLNMTKEEHFKKKEAIDKYIYPQAPCGKPWSGTLPKIFINANCWNKELYFRIK